jgi:hypothetical protein
MLPSLSIRAWYILPFTFRLKYAVFRETQSENKTESVNANTYRRRI